MDIPMQLLAEALHWTIKDAKVNEALISLNQDPNATASNIKIEVTEVNKRSGKALLEIIFDYRTTHHQAGVRDLLVRLHHAKDTNDFHIDKVVVI